MAEEIQDTEESVVDTAVPGEESTDGSPADSPPDYETRFREAQERQEALQKELSEARTAAEARMRQLEGVLGAAFSRPAAAQPAEPEISDEEFMSDPRAAARRLARQEAASLVEQSNRQTAEVMRSLIERSFKAEYNAARASDPEGFKAVQKDLDGYFEANPAAKNAPGAVDDAMSYFIGKAVREGRYEMAKPSSSGAPFSPSTKTPAPTGPGLRPTKRELTKAQQRLAAQYGMTEEDWFETEDNPEYHDHMKRVKNG